MSKKSIGQATLSKFPAGYAPETAFVTTDDFGMVYNLRQAKDPKTGHKSWRKGEPLMENDIAVSIRIDGRGAPKEMQKEVACAIRDQLNAKYPVGVPLALFVVGKKGSGKSRAHEVKEWRRTNSNGVPEYIGILPGDKPDAAGRKPAKKASEKTIKKSATAKKIAAALSTIPRGQNLEISHTVSSDFTPLKKPLPAKPKSRAKRA
jgi:hypothetical protein